MLLKYGTVFHPCQTYRSLNNREFLSLSNSEDGLVALVALCAYPYEGKFFTKGLLRGLWVFDFYGVTVLVVRVEINRFA